MANTFTGTILVSSAGTAGPIILDPTARQTNITCVFTTTNTIDLTVQGSMWVPGSGSSQTWVDLSSHIGGTSVSGNNLVSVLGPLAGIRVNSTTFGAGSAIVQVLQAITG